MITEIAVDENAQSKTATPQFKTNVPMAVKKSPSRRQGRIANWLLEKAARSALLSRARPALDILLSTVLNANQVPSRTDLQNPKHRTRCAGVLAPIGIRDGSQSGHQRSSAKRNTYEQGHHHDKGRRRDLL